MPTFDLIKMAFESPLHLAKGRADFSSAQEFLHSDKLKSAIFSTAVDLYGDDVTIPSKGEPELLQAFTVSSAFPFFEDGLYFPLPKIALAPIVDNGKAIDNQGKISKKIRFVNQYYFEKICNGTLTTIPKEDLLQDGSLLSNQTIDDKLREENGDFYIYRKKVDQRVSIPRYGDADAEPFYFERLFFRNEAKAGLFFLVQYHQAELSNGLNVKNIVEATIRFLGDEGIGSDRADGNGQFCPSFGELNLNTPTTGTTQTNLSLYLPSKLEHGANLLTGNHAFNLLKRGGYIAAAEDFDDSSLRKSAVYMFEEGSVFDGQLALNGYCLDVKPAAQQMKSKHSIWRDGRAIFIKMK